MTEGRLFVSYSTADSDKVGAVVDRLKEYGLDVWIDQDQIGLGDNIVSRIDEGLRAAKYFLIFASQSYFERAWTRDEYFAAFYSALTAAERKVFVIELEDVELPPLLAARRHIRWTGPEAVAGEIAAAIARADAGRGPSGITPSLPADATPRGGKSMVWAELQDTIFDAVLPRLLEQIEALARTTVSVVSVRIDLPGVASLTCNVKMVLLSEDLRAEVPHVFKLRRTHRKIGRMYADRLARGGLAVLEPAFVIAAEENQKNLDQVNERLWSQLDEIAPIVNFQRQET